ncbi:MAG: yrbH [Devosia sp.]|nr:yrbH [Devosia sp.]
MIRIDCSVNLTIAPAELVQIGRSALRIEAAAIADFAEFLGEQFVKGVELLTQPSGRIIVTGIGKSGHVARKIASTLSSIGRPALYIHPSEASHGDLGMIGEGDVLMALSNSGETAELGDIIGYCESRAISILAIVGNGNSTLAQRARVALVYGMVKEVCANGLAPTTSTTLAMAIGDALAVGVMTVLGTTSESFRLYHPGGRLGASLLKVQDLMHCGDRLPLVRHDMFMKDVVVIMSAKGFGVAVVQDEDGRIAGLITDGDMRRHVEVLWDSRAKDLVSARPITVSPSLLASRALEIMTERGVTSLLVADEANNETGLIHIHDCLRAGL